LHARFRTQIFDAAVVRRVDPVLGLLLELPMDPTPAAAFAHVSNLADGRVDKPEKAFKAGQKVKARVMGFRLVDGLALVSLKPSVIAQQVGAGATRGLPPRLFSRRLSLPVAAAPLNSGSAACSC
jgi:hypothetical protein